MTGSSRWRWGGLNLPSIRKDLADYKTANWGIGFSNLNLNAYLYGMEYKITTDFLVKFDPKYKTDLDQALKDLFNNACNKSKTIDLCMSTVQRDMTDALDK